MTDLLKRAFDEASKLPPAEQDVVAAWLIEELESERKWDDFFRNSEDMLERMAAEAMAEYEAGVTQELNPESLC
jgi:hypothetical protein